MPGLEGTHRLQEEGGGAGGAPAGSFGREEWRTGAVQRGAPALGSGSGGCSVPGDLPVPCLLSLRPACSPGALPALPAPCLLSLALAQRW